MKKQLTLSLLSFLLLTGCAKSGVERKEKTPISDEQFLRFENACQQMVDHPFRMSYEGTITEEYPDVYAYFNNTVTASALSEYGTYKSETDTVHEAIRLIDGNVQNTYFEDEEGFAVEAALSVNNEVSYEPYKIFGRKLVYSTYFANPFDSISGDDFSEDAVMNSTKAYYLLNTFTGIEHSVKSAKFTFDEEGRFDKVIFDFNKTPFGIVDGYDTLDGYRTMTGQIQFTYDVVPFEPIQPSNVEQKALKEKLSNISNNFTLFIDSDVLAAPVLVYVTEGLVYIHYDANKSYCTYGDQAYLLRNGSYRPYTFTSDWEFSAEGNQSIENIVPQYSSYSSNIFDQVSENTYRMKEEAVKYSADRFFIPHLGLEGGYGKKFTATIRENSLLFTGIFASSSATETVKAVLFDCGTTTCPSWLSEKDIVK